MELMKLKFIENDQVIQNLNNNLTNFFIIDHFTMFKVS